MTVSVPEFISAVRSVCGHGEIALHEPLFRDFQSVDDCVRDGAVGYEKIIEFETLLAQTVGVKRAVAVASGTAALHLALIVCGVRPGDEVMVPALTFAASANAIIHAGAVPHFVDSSKDDLGVDTRNIMRRLSKCAARASGPPRTVNVQSGRRIAAIMPVHLLGHPCDMSNIWPLALESGIEVIEDAAEALGSKVSIQSCGSMGTVSAMSFNCNKIVTTGGGGALLTNDHALADRAAHLATTARIQHPWKYDHDAVGYNYRMPNICAALGLGQLRRLADLVDLKRSVARKYAEVFSRTRGCRFIYEPTGTHSNYWLNAVLLNDASQRDEILQALHADGIRARAMFTPLHMLPHFARYPRDDLSVAEDLAARIICLPSSPKLGESR